MKSNMSDKGIGRGDNKIYLNAFKVILWLFKTSVSNLA